MIKMQDFFDKPLIFLAFFHQYTCVTPSFSRVWEFFSRPFLAFPYNPYHPEPYSRFTESGMMDSPNDFLVGDEYWDFIGGKGTFPELLKTFDEVGKQFKERLNQKFKDIAKDKLDSY